MPIMSEWPELQSQWEMDWGQPRGKETVRVIDHQVPIQAVCLEARDGVTWVPLDVFTQYATPTAEGMVIEPAEPVHEFKTWRP